MNITYFNGLVRWLCVMVGPRAVTVVFLMVAAASTWTAAVQAAAAPKAIAGPGRNAESSTNAVAAPPYAELSISVTDLLSALENGTDDTRLQAAINDLELQPQQQYFQQQKQKQQQQQQPRKFRHEASAVRILYQIGVSIFD